MLFRRIIHGPLRSIMRSLHHYNIVNDAISKNVISLINPTGATIIVPYSDYPGEFTNTLLSTNYEKLVLCEANRSTRSELEKYVKTNYPERNVDIYEHDILGRSFKVECDDCQDVIRTSLSGCSRKKDWKTLTSNKLVVPLLKKKLEATFFASLYYQTAYRNGLFMNGRMEFYMFVSGRQFMYLTSKPSENLSFYRASTVLFNTVFDLELLHTMNLREAFNINLRKIQSINFPVGHPRLDLYNEIHLVKITPKADLFERFTSNTLLEFRFLVNQCMHSRTANVITFMERWFQNCNEDLYRMGFDDSKRFGDMTRDDLLRLYKYVSSRPDYHMSTLHAAASVVETSIERLDEAQLIGC